MEEKRNNKIQRILGIYTRLLEGRIVNKQTLAAIYGVNERSIQRDVNDIRDFLKLDAEENSELNSVVYDHRQKGYRLESINQAN